MYDYTYEASMKKFVVWEHDGMKCTAVLITETQKRAERASALYEKYGAGQLRYPTK
jgi:hypothetical protein